MQRHTVNHSFEIMTEKVKTYSFKVFVPIHNEIYREDLKCFVRFVKTEKRLSDFIFPVVK